MGEEEKKEEFELEPVEIHPEMYATDLFGETPTKEIVDSFTLSDAQGLTLGRQPFNIWALTDAIGARKKKDAWVLYQKALASGMVPEEVFYKLVWQVKNMLLVGKTKSVTETEMKPYPYQKAKEFVRNFKPGELEKLSESIVLGYHKARRGIGEIETLVEKTLLKL